MTVSLTTVRYKKWQTPFALLAMAIFRVPLSMQKGCTFWKLLGTGKNKHVTLTPDWQQWAILATWDDRASFEEFYQRSFIAFWWNFFLVERWTILLEPLQSHGKWGGKEPFSSVVMKDYQYQGPVAVLTRANIRYSKFWAFWRSVRNVESQLYKAKGYAMSIGIGETFSLVATFSVWDSVENMKAFSYAGGDHKDVIKRARDEGWFSEELFTRFKPIDSFGTINGQNPLKGII